MRIGELASRSQVPVRMLRYYEEQACWPRSGPNGYREYSESDIARVALVSSLVRSGLPTKLIVPLLRHGSDDRPEGSSAAQLVSAFEEEAARLDAKIACMTLSRNAIRRYLDSHESLARSA